MKLNKIAAVALLGLAFSMPLMAGGELSKQLIAEAKKAAKGMTAEELQVKIENEDDLFMLDIREPYMRPEGSIEGMENVEVPRGLLEFEITEKIEDKNALVIVYCRSGKGAALSAKMLKEDMHYTNVYYLKGGLDSWLEAGGSVFNHLGELKLAK